MSNIWVTWDLIKRSIKNQIKPSILINPQSGSEQDHQSTVRLWTGSSIHSSALNRIRTGLRPEKVLKGGLRAPKGGSRAAKGGSRWIDRISDPPFGSGLHRISRWTPHFSESMTETQFSSSSFGLPSIIFKLDCGYNLCISCKDINPHSKLPSK